MNNANVNVENRLGDNEACDRNPKQEHFDQVVATWQTVRHFDVRSYDTIVPVNREGLRHESFERCIGSRIEKPIRINENECCKKV